MICLRRHSALCLRLPISFVFIHRDLLALSHLKSRSPRIVGLSALCSCPPISSPPIHRDFLALSPQILSATSLPIFFTLIPREFLLSHLKSRSPRIVLLLSVCAYHFSGLDQLRHLCVSLRFAHLYLLP